MPLPHLPLFALLQEFSGPETVRARSPQNDRSRTATLQPSYSARILSRSAAFKVKPSSTSHGPRWTHLGSAAGSRFPPWPLPVWPFPMPATEYTGQASMHLRAAIRRVAKQIRTVEHCARNHRRNCIKINIRCPKTIAVTA